MAFFHFRRRKATEPPSEQDEKKDLVIQIEKAKREWNLARIQLNEMYEPELIDYAVYRLQAAERHYMYLLKRAEQVGICRHY